MWVEHIQKTHNRLTERQLDVGLPGDEVSTDFRNGVRKFTKAVKQIDDVGQSGNESSWW